MGKSLEYCRTVALDKTRSSYTDRDWNAAIEREAEPFFDVLLNGNHKITVSGIGDKGEQLSIHLDIIFDPSADFQYFTSESCVHDGTLLFISELYTKCVKKVCSLQTWNKRICTPKNEDHIVFTIGNFVELEEYGQEFAPEDKSWMQTRSTLLLPLRIEYL